MPTAEQKAEYNWHLWRKDLKTGLKSYIGAMYDEAEALKKKKALAAENPGCSYAVLNYGPVELGRRSGQVINTRPAVKAPSSKAAEAMRAAREESRRKDAEAQSVRNKQAAKRAADKARNDAEMAEIRADAEGLMEGHKADEAADLKAGINR